MNIFKIIAFVGLVFILALPLQLKAQEQELDEPAGELVAVRAKRTPSSEKAKGASTQGGGREVATMNDLYAAIPGEAKKSEVVGGLVKSYSGKVDMICAKDTMICIVTFKDGK